MVSTACVHEGLLRPRVARAQKIIRLHPLLPYFIFKSSLIDPRLRVSNEHIPIVRVARAQETNRLPSSPLPVVFSPPR
jgi:hypothetical protein